LQAEDPES
jgi:hypothetical protein